jgi:hypothetical protein
MNIQTAEKELAKYHVLHFAIGLVLSMILLAIPKLIGVCLAVFVIAMVLPATILPEFTQSKWLDRFAVLAGAIVVGVVFHFLHKL